MKVFHAPREVKTTIVLFFQSLVPHDRAFLFSAETKSRLDGWASSLLPRQAILYLDTFTKCFVQSSWDYYVQSNCKMYLEEGFWPGPTEHQRAVCFFCHRRRVKSPEKTPSSLLVACRNVAGAAVLSAIGRACQALKGCQLWGCIVKLSREVGEWVANNTLNRIINSL